jgi:hypothetical protein
MKDNSQITEDIIKDLVRQQKMYEKLIFVLAVFVVLFGAGLIALLIKIN